MGFWDFVDKVNKVGDVLAAPIYACISGAEAVAESRRIHPDDFLGGIVTPNKYGKFLGEWVVDNDSDWVYIGNGKYRRVLDRKKFNQYIERGLDKKTPLSAQREGELLLPDNWSDDADDTE